jgi:hypothetical protein
VVVVAEVVVVIGVVSSRNGLVYQNGIPSGPLRRYAGPS